MPPLSFPVAPTPDGSLVRRRGLLLPTVLYEPLEAASPLGSRSSSSSFDSVTLEDELTPQPHVRWYYEWLCEKDGSLQLEPYSKAISEELEAAFQQGARSHQFPSEGTPAQPLGVLVEVHFALMLELGPSTAVNVVRRVSERRSPKPGFGLPRKASLKKAHSFSGVFGKKRVNLGDAGRTHKEVWVFDTNSYEFPDRDM